MKKNKLIIFEGTDCSGKETQANLVIERLKKDKIKICKLSFPNYDSPTGKIVAGPFLGKEIYGKCFFDEKPYNVDSKVASLYYAADRRYNLPLIKAYLGQGNLILDRYVESNMAFQAGKLRNKEDRLAMYKWLNNLEYTFLELPKPDLVVFLYMPYKYSLELKKKRGEKPDQIEKSATYLKVAEKAYLELAKLRNYITVKCIKNGELRTIEDINDEVYEIVKRELTK